MSKESDALRHQLDAEEAIAVQAQNRARHAQNLLENPLLNEGIQAIKDQLWAEFSQSPLDDDRCRLQARMGVDMLDRILKYLKKKVKDGDVADLALTEIKRKRGLFKRVA